ncbi:MAG: hypothetical protein ABI472_02945 [Ginsengibacter sp.]
MTTKGHGFFLKRFIKLSLAICIICLLALSIGYVWFIDNSKRLLIDLVNDRSKGRLKLKIAEVTFNFVNSEVKIREAKITSTNKNNDPIIYQVSFSKIMLHTNSLWSLLLSQSLEIKQIKAFDPVIEVYNSSQTGPDSVNKLSIGVELGKMYNSIQEGISALRTHSIYVINAKLILHNQAAIGKKPIVFSNIYFTLKKLHKYNNKPGQYLESNNLTFTSSDQDIMLSDGIHKLLFKKLSIKQASTIILDSCTIIGLPLQAADNKYSITFKRLALVGVDFNALYEKNIIRADSVYCENPVSDINLNSTLTDSSTTAKEIPDIERILKKFSGNLDLGFVGVMNADIHLNIKGKRSLSDFHSGRVNFQIKNLRINPDSSKLISMKNFDMMVKGYKLYNTDSTSVFSFDSVRFSNDKLLLNNFSVHTLSGKNKSRNYRNYNIHYFELLGINWSELLFNQFLTASQATLYDPVINFRKDKKVDISKKSILFNSHQTFDDLMEIEKLNIVNGTINIRWGITNSLQLTGLNLGLFGENLTDYKHVRLYQDVETLSFTNGLLKIGDINAQLRNVIFNADNQLRAGELLIKNSSGQIDSKIEDVTINTILLEKNNSRIIVDGLLWTKGSIKVNAIKGSKQKRKYTSLRLKNIEGKQTLLQINKKDMEADAFINDVHIDSILQQNEEPVEINGLRLTGEHMHFSHASLQIKSDDFNVSDNTLQFMKATLQQNNSAGNLMISVPSVKLTGAFNKYFSNYLHVDNIELQSPEINFQKENISPAFSTKKNLTPAIAIDHVTIYEPVLNVLLKDSSPRSNFSLPYSKASEIKINNVTIDSNLFTAGDFKLTSGKVVFIKDDKKVADIDGSIDLSLQKINYPIALKGSAWKTNLITLSLQNSKGFTFDIKGNKLRLKDMAIGNVSLNSDVIKNPGKLLMENPGAWVRTSVANYLTKNSSWQVENINYNGSKKELVVDTIQYRPLLSRDSAIAASPYQTDYMYYSSGKALFTGIDLVALLHDNSLSIQTANFSHPSIYVYRDKLPPFLAGIRKKLFTEEIKNLDLPVSINEVKINDGKVSYTEKNAESRLDGNLVLAHLHGSILKIKNYELRATDSLSINITGLLLDKAPFDLDMNQSYQDTLYGFLMNLQVDSTPLYILNPLLAPLSNIKFVSGSLSSFRMNAIGNENLSYGHVKFYYHNMHIRLLKNGGTEKTKLLKSAESNLVNFFFVRNNNTSRTGLIYFERIKDRSFFNYMSKIIFSGISTSVGARKNSKYRRLYRKHDLDVK